EKRAAHVFGLLTCEGEKPLVDGGEVDGDLRLERLAVAALRIELHTEITGLRDGYSSVSCRDEALGGYDIGEHCRAADTHALHEGHLGAELGSGERCFISAGTATEDGDALSALERG